MTHAGPLNKSRIDPSDQASDRSPIENQKKVQGTIQFRTKRERRIARLNSNPPQRKPIGLWPVRAEPGGGSRFSLYLPLARNLPGQVSEQWLKQEPDLELDPPPESIRAQHGVIETEDGP